MILHFSHIGLTEGRTFTLRSRSFSWKSFISGFLAGALATVAVAATSAKRRLRVLLPTLKPQRGMLATSARFAVTAYLRCV